MSDPAYGFTPDVVRKSMPDFTLGADLLRGIAGAIPPPPDGVSGAWRRDRCARIIVETASSLPADAAQGRLAAQMLILRDMADDTFARSRAPGLTLEQVLRARSVADRLSCSAERMERALARRQQRPTPFWGNVAAAALTISEVDEEWGRRAPGGGREVGEEKKVVDAGLPAFAGAGPAGMTGMVRGDAAEGPAMMAAAIAATDVPPEVEKEEVKDAGPAAFAGTGSAGMTGSRIAATDPVPDATAAGGEPPRRSRAGVTVEYGEGYSVEIWPAVQPAAADGTDKGRAP